MTMAEIEELRTQPQDIQAEQSVLGAIFIDEGKLVFVREFIEPADFFKYAHLIQVIAEIASKHYIFFFHIPAPLIIIFFQGYAFRIET